MRSRGVPSDLKMASNTPKWPFPGQICLSPHRRGSTQHAKMGECGTGTPQCRVLRLGSRFLPKSVHRVGGVPYVHRGGGTLVTPIRGGLLFSSNACTPKGIPRCHGITVCPKSLKMTKKTRVFSVRGACFFETSGQDPNKT